MAPGGHRDRIGRSVRDAGRHHTGPGGRPLPGGNPTSPGGPVTTGGTPDPDRFTFSIQVVVQATSGSTDGLIGMVAAGRLPAREPVHTGRVPSAALELHRCRADAGADRPRRYRTCCWWRPRPGASRRWSPTAPSSPAFPSPPTRCAYHAGEPAFATGAVTAVPRGEIIGGVAVGDLADAGGSGTRRRDLRPHWPMLRVERAGPAAAGLPGPSTDPTFSGPAAVQR